MEGVRRRELLLIVAACLIAATKLSGGSLSARGEASSSQVRSPPLWGFPRRNYRRPSLALALRALAIPLDSCTRL
jgi:hypothetical protein